MKCKYEWCEAPASEANGMCFDCAEETAVLMHDAVLEFGGTPEQARKSAQSTWK